MQYEQLIETMENIFKVPSDLVRPPSEVPMDNKNSDETDYSMGTFEIGAKRKLYNQSSVAESQKSKMEPKVSFELPLLCIQLKNLQNDPLIDIIFRDFNVRYERSNVYETNIEVSLRSLQMEDLLQAPESKHRSMLVSSSYEPPMNRQSSGFSSRSCPNLIGLHFSDECVTGSLPGHLECKSGLNQMQTMLHKPNCPETPPPSPQPKMRQENLVLYSSMLVDTDCPSFETQYRSVHQSSSIDFNSLDLVVSVQSWIVLLNFFGLLSNDIEDSTSSTNVISQPTEIDQHNSKLDISVRSLTLVFIRPDYEIAKANVSNASLVISKFGSIKTVEGKLGSISLLDLTTHGALYRERFLTSGNEALSFAYTQSGTRTNVRSLKKDSKLKIQMSSVRYVHTKRFVAEIHAFFEEFQQLQTPVLRKIKPSDSKTNLLQRPTQLELEINAGSPIILLPLSSRSEKVIVADLGEFSLKNSFHLASESGIIR